MQVVAVPVGLPARTFAEFLALARSRPGQLNIGSGGNGNLGHLTFELLKRQTGIDVAHVPYRGSSLASQDMLAGRVHLMIDPYGTVRGAAEAGHVRLLAVTSAERVASLPEVPTLPEAGGPPGFEVTGFVGFVAPGTTPRPLLSRLEQAVAWAMRETDLPRAYDAQGLVLRFADGTAFRALMARERGRWERLAQETSIALD